MADRYKASWESRARLMTGLAGDMRFRCEVDLDPSIIRCARRNQVA